MAPPPSPCSGGSGREGRQGRGRGSRRVLPKGPLPSTPSAAPGAVLPAAARGLDQSPALAPLCLPCTPPGSRVMWGHLPQAGPAFSFPPCPCVCTARPRARPSRRAQARRLRQDSVCHGGRGSLRSPEPGQGDGSGDVGGHRRAGSGGLLRTPTPGPTPFCPWGPGRGADPAHTPALWQLTARGRGSAPRPAPRPGGSGPELPLSPLRLGGPLPV